MLNRCITDRPPLSDFELQAGCRQFDGTQDADRRPNHFRSDPFARQNADQERPWDRLFHRVLGHGGRLNSSVLCLALLNKQLTERTTARTRTGLLPSNRVPSTGWFSNPEL